MLGEKASWAKKKKMRFRMYTLLILINSVIFTITPASLYGSESEALSDEIDPSLEIELETESEVAPDLSSPMPVPITLPEAIDALPMSSSHITELKTDNVSANQTTDHASTEDKTTSDSAPQPPDVGHSTSELRRPRASDVIDEGIETSPEIKAPPAPKPLILLGTEIPPGMATRVAWRPGHSLKGLASQAPVLVVHGKKTGPTLCITAAVHGDELNGIEVVRQVLHRVKASKLKGTIIGVPIVNIQGFLRNSRYLVDRRDLNRFFPGTAHGSLASRIANSFFKQVIANCSALVDIHTGSFYRDNIPQLRADLGVPSVVKLTKGFSSTLVLHSTGAQGTLRKAAVSFNIPAVTLELGGPMILDEKAVEHGVEGILNLLNDLNMYKKASFWGTPKPVYYHSQWVRAEHGGIFFSKVKLGEKISPGDLLGTITNPITNEQFLLTSPYEGEVVGLAHNQVVYPGFATTHLAIEPTSELNQQINTLKPEPEPEPEKIEND